MSADIESDNLEPSLEDRLKTLKEFLEQETPPHWRRHIGMVRTLLLAAIYTHPEIISRGQEHKLKLEKNIYYNSKTKIVPAIIDNAAGMAALSYYLNDINYQDDSKAPLAEVLHIFYSGLQSSLGINPSGSTGPIL